MTFLLISTDEGVFVDTNGAAFKDVILQWGELPTSVGKYFGPAISQEFSDFS